MHVHNMHTVKAQKRVLDPLEPELSVVVSHHVDSGTKLRSWTRATSALTHGTISPVLALNIFFSFSIY